MDTETEDIKKSSAMFDEEAAASLVKELRATFNTGKTLSYQWRVEQLQRILKMVEDHEEDIVDALRQDLSKPQFESYLVEISLLKSACTKTIKQLHHWMKPEKVKTSVTVFPASAEIVPEPLGVILIISAWNYPFLISLEPVIGAIAAGNVAVLKPSEVAPATSSLLAKLVEKYLNNSAVKVVEGAVDETTDLLKQKWDKIMYTGNGRVGSIIMRAAAKYLTPVLLELGGKCPVIVDSRINLKVTTQRLIVGKWGSNNGQACVVPDYIITTKDFAATLVDALKTELEKCYGKDPLYSMDISRIVNSNHFSRVSRLLDEKKVSSNIVHGGLKDESKLRISPTILLDVPEDSLIMTEEIFGPLLPIVTVDKVEDGFHIINSRPKPLAAYLFTNDKKLKESFVKAVSAGALVINDVTLHLAVETIPFGGVGESGIGAYHGKHSFDAFSHRKGVLYRSFYADATARYPPYTAGKLNLLQALLSRSILRIVRALFSWS